jgi:hypothetical protein
MAKTASRKTTRPVVSGSARLHLAKLDKPNGVVLIGKAQEKALGYTARRKDHGTKVWFDYSRHEVRVTYYYFCILDEEFGLFFTKVCTYLPFNVTVCFNGHSYLASWSCSQRS